MPGRRPRPIASDGTGGAAPVPRSSLAHTGSGVSPGHTSPTGGGITFSADDVPSTGSGGAAAPGSTPDPTTGNSSGVTAGVVTPFNVFVLDNKSGVVLYPNVDQFATLNGWMDLVAQVEGELPVRIHGIRPAFPQPTSRARAPISLTSDGIVATQRVMATRLR